MTSILFSSAIAGCSDQPIQPQLQGKTTAEQMTFLVEECESEAWQGHDIGTHRLNRYKQENKGHVSNMKRICHALAEPGTTKAKLITECMIEAQNKASFSSDRYVTEHNNRLLEICAAFEQVAK